MNLCVLPGFALVRQTTDCLAVAAMCVTAIALDHALSHPLTERVVEPLIDRLLP